MAVPKVIYLIDGDKKCVGKHRTGEGLCNKPINGGIFWTCNDDGRLCCGHFYCKKHLDMNLKEWSTDGKVSVRQPDGEDIEKDIEELIQSNNKNLRGNKHSFELF